MSGPKVDEATLARQKAEQLELERRAKAEALSMYCACVFQIRSEMQIMKRKYQSINEQVKGISALGYACGDIEEILDDCTHKTEAEITAADPVHRRSKEDGISSLEIVNLTERMRQNCKHILSFGEDEILGPYERINEYVQKIENLKEKNKLFQDLASFQRERLDVQDQFEFAGGAYNDKPDLGKSSLLHVSKPDLISQIEDILSMDYVCFEDRQWLEGVRNSVEVEMSEARLQDTANQFYLHKSAILQNRVKFAKSFSEYEAEAILLSEISGEPLNIKDAHGFATLKALRAEIDRIRLREAEVESQNYIRKTIAAVMWKRGYKLQQDVVFREGDTNKHTIFSKPEADSSGTAAAIHVRYSEDDSAVMFEVVGADPVLFFNEPYENKKVKEPIINCVGSQSIANEEINNLLLRLQVDLCPEFDEVRKECEKYGVILRNQSDKKPDVKNNRLIAAIPVNDSGSSEVDTNSKNRGNLQNRALSL